MSKFRNHGPQQLCHRWSKAARGTLLVHGCWMLIEATSSVHTLHRRQRWLDRPASLERSSCLRLRLFLVFPAWSSWSKAEYSAANCCFSWLRSSNRSPCGHAVRALDTSAFLDALGWDHSGNFWSRSTCSHVGWLFVASANVPLGWHTTIPS
jgi:hypothetical protein